MLRARTTENLVGDALLGALNTYVADVELPITCYTL